MLPQDIVTEGAIPHFGPTNLNLTDHLVGAKKAGHIIGGKLYGRKLGAKPKRTGIQGIAGTKTGSTKSIGKNLGNSTEGSTNKGTLHQPNAPAFSKPKKDTIKIGKPTSQAKKFREAFAAAKETVIGVQSKFKAGAKANGPFKGIPKPGVKAGGID